MPLGVHTPPLETQVIASGEGQLIPLSAHLQHLSLPILQRTVSSNEPTNTRIHIRHNEPTMTRG